LRTSTLLSHTADARAELAGDSLAELFRAGLEALAELELGEPPALGAATPVRRRLVLDAIDATALLVDFLSEALSLSLELYAVFTAAEFDRLDERGLSADILGRPVAGFARDVKAVTYHEADVRRGEDGVFRTRLVFDI
jgi:SHS2 domain-containing protein